MRDVVIVSAVRTPLGSFGGTLSTTGATTLVLAIPSADAETIRAIAGSIGGMLDRERVAEELISHLVALLGVRSAHLYLGDEPDTAECVSAVGRPTHSRNSRWNSAWNDGSCRCSLTPASRRSNAGTRVSGT